MAKRNEHSLAEIKAMVLAAAETIITEQGFSALTIRKVAMEMGYTVGSIYMVFASRAELIQDINTRTQADIVAQLDAIDNIETWLSAYLDYARTHTDRWRMTLLDTTEYQIQLDSVFLQFACYFPNLNSQSVQALWLGIQGICLLSPENEWDAAVLALLAIHSKV
jgi:AcrR family transcriptional regulator